MPYTPPSVQSPVASKTQSPTLSRTNSYSKDQDHENGIPSSGRRLSFPHSSSAYLTKHRRSPSTTQAPSPPTDTFSPTKIGYHKGLQGSTGQTPSPSSEKTEHSPSQPDISRDSTPSVSPPSPGDDDNTENRGRRREVTNLAELQAAIKIIEQHRAGSPDGQSYEETKKARVTLGLDGPRIDLSKIGGPSESNDAPQRPLSSGARKISHSRSTTDTSAFFDFPRNKFDSPALNTSQSDDEDIEDDELRIKPALIRKKSGELVRPALRPSSAKRRPSSMPGTPTYSKAVHFQEQSLEHVRHFLQVDKPIAVSAGSSPVDPYDDDLEFPFGDDADEWEIRVTNFPRNTIEQQVLPVRTEKVYLSADTKVLHGRVAVRNLAFHKQVVARFTLDNWKTTSEVVAEYSNDVRKQHINDRYDRFVFSIKLEDQANLENKIMFFCVRYSVNGQDYWDNNNSINYQVEFTKKPKFKEGLQASKAVKTIPRNKSSMTFSPRPRSMPSFDDFANLASPYEFTSFPRPSAIVGDSPIRFKNKSAADEAPNAAGKSKSPANQAFGNRYDFGASLSAAIQAAGSPTGSPKEGNQSVSRKAEAQTGLSDTKPNADAAKPINGVGISQAKSDDVSKPAALTSEKPSLSSSSYHELLDKYCFFGSGKSTSQPVKPTRPQFDGASDDSTGTENASGKQSKSPSPSPPRRSSPPVEGRESPQMITSPRASRAASPATGSAMGSRTASPAFGYPYHQHMQNRLFDTHAPTAIRG